MLLMLYLRSILIVFYIITNFRSTIIPKSVSRHRHQHQAMWVTRGMPPARPLPPERAHTHTHTQNLICVFVKMSTTSSGVKGFITGEAPTIRTEVFLL